MNISETPDNWVILKIDDNNNTYYKVFGTWVGGYLGSDRWKLNSGIDKVEQDDDYYYFIGFSGSCYKCHKKSYGTITSFGAGILNDIVDKGNGKVIVLDDKQDWESLYEI